MSRKDSSEFKNSVKETVAEAATCKTLHRCELLPLTAYKARAVLIVDPVSVHTSAGKFAQRRPNGRR